MLQFLDQLIPKKATSEQICKILKEIWVDETIIEEDKRVIMEDSDEDIEDFDEEGRQKKGVKKVEIIEEDQKSIKKKKGGPKS